MKKINTLKVLRGVLFLSLTVLITGLQSCKSDKEKLSDTILSGEQKLFNDSTKELNDSVAAGMIRNYQAYASAYKDDSLSGEYLFRAAELNNALHFYKESVDLYERLIKEFPNHRKTSTALFMEAFVYDTGLHNPDQAKAKYKEFIDKYPDHQLAASAKASFEQLSAGLSDEELIRMFEAQRDSGSVQAK